MASSTPTPEYVIQACREWLKLAGATTALTDAQVIPADDKGPRPPLPYLTVKLTASDVAVGEDEPVTWLGDQLTVATAAAGTVYTVTVNDEVVTYTRLAGQSNTQVAAGLAAAINAAVDLVHAENVAAVVWLAALTGELVTTEADANLTLAADSVAVAGLLAQRSASLSVQSFDGATPLTAAAWLERAALRLAMPDVITLLDAAGLSVEANGGMTDLSSMVDTSIEGRRLREFDVSYAIRTEPVLLTPLEVVTAALTIEKYDGDPDPYTVSLEVEVS